MSDREISQEVVTKVPFPLTVGTLLDFAEALKDRPRDERVEYVKLGPIGGQYLRHRRAAIELPPTSVPSSAEDVRSLHVGLLASEAIQLAREGRTVLALFTDGAIMHAWADYEIRALTEQGGTNFSVNRKDPRYWTLVFEGTGMAAFSVAGPTFSGSYDTVLTDARVPRVP